MADQRDDSLARQRQYQLIRELLEQVATRQDLINMRREIAAAIEGLTDIVTSLAEKR